MVEIVLNVHNMIMEMLLKIRSIQSQWKLLCHVSWIFWFI